MRLIAIPANEAAAPNDDDLARDFPHLPPDGEWLMPEWLCRGLTGQAPLSRADERLANWRNAPNFSPFVHLATR